MYNQRKSARLDRITTTIHDLLEHGKLDATTYSSTLKDVFDYCTGLDFPFEIFHNYEAYTASLYKSITQVVTDYLSEQAKQIKLGEVDEFFASRRICSSRIQSEALNSEFFDKYKKYSRIIKHLLNLPERHMYKYHLEPIETCLESCYQQAFLPIIYQRTIVYNERIAFIRGFYDENCIVTKLPLEIVWLICELIPGSCSSNSNGCGILSGLAGRVC